MTTPKIQGATLYVDCFSGIAGDMLLAALVDLGVPRQVVESAVAQLGLRAELKFQTVKRSSLRGLHVEVLVDGERVDNGVNVDSRRPVQAPHDHSHAHDHPHDHPHDPPHDAAHAHDHDHRAFSDIRTLLTTKLPSVLAARALAIFAPLAEVEARAHHIAVEDVTFHEVGAVDSIADIVGVAAAIEWLLPAAIWVRRIPLGHGQVRTQHGLLPVPTPATLALLHGFPVEDGGVAKELTTPTGAALAHALMQPATGFPAGAPIAAGWGAGSRDFADRPNLLRVVALETQPTANDSAPDGTRQLWQLEANIDDMNPQLFAPLLDALFVAGARDAWLQPIQMKKGRPATLVAILVDEPHRLAVEAALFAGSTTIGVRRFAVERTELERQVELAETSVGPLQVKVSRLGDEVRRTPEYDDVVRLAAAQGLSVKDLYYRLLGELSRP